MAKFAAVKQMTRPYLYSWLLLAVFVPTVLLSSLHVHRSIADADLVCMECVHNISHPQHFSKPVLNSDTCWFCHFLTLNYLVVAATAILCLNRICHLLGTATITDIIRAERGASLSRGPPVACCTI